MVPLFNTDMGNRIADLWKAVEAGAEVSCAFRPKAKVSDNHWIDDRIVVSIPETGREFSLALPMARAVADQLAENGYPVFADRLRPAP